MDLTEKLRGDAGSLEYRENSTKNRFHTSDMRISYLFILSNENNWSAV
jgi:hypothetical protein